MDQRASEGNVIVIHETVVGVGMKLLCRRKPTAQFRGIMFGNQSAYRDLDRIVIPVSPAPLLGHRPNGMSRNAPQLLRALQGISGAKLMVGVIEKVPRRLCVLLDLHVSILLP